ncbi:hypothetical protein PAHAL_1G412100 [Panicum hallii]|jgi:hypothetical protein|uniref:Uncharacterized protein n=1 Tax=Panicum hallii TaxID=206008 RepID=A0A2T8KY19_9POAL|nr:hypothetical protein PAHAL_1G412100 [Panicum hallii]
MRGDGAEQYPCVGRCAAPIARYSASALAEGSGCVKERDLLGVAPCLGAVRSGAVALSSPGSSLRAAPWPKSPATPAGFEPLESGRHHALRRSSTRAPPPRQARPRCSPRTCGLRNGTSSARSASTACRTASARRQSHLWHSASCRHPPEQAETRGPRGGRIRGRPRRGERAISRPGGPPPPSTTYFTDWPLILSNIYKFPYFGLHRD